MALIEAVPNISEGKNLDVLQHLAQVLKKSPDIDVLNVDPNPSANRTVFTLIGEPQNMCAALFNFIRAATQVIDMRWQHGAHPRLGVVDVCPLIPLRDISLEKTAQWARNLGQQVGEKLSVPVYLYEAAARTEKRKNLADIRRGEYENLPQKLHDFPPDFGPNIFSESVQKTGACIIGARNFLIAFNINLNTQDEAPAKQIAARLRESGGGLRGVKAIGWYMENFKRAQVSCNIVDFHATPLHLVFETCQKEAATLGLQATGCELVGLIPLEAILTAGRHYAPDETDPKKQIAAAIKHLHLDEVKPFEPQEQILEIKAGLIAS